MVNGATKSCSTKVICQKNVSNGDIWNYSFWTEFDGDKSSYKVMFYEGDLSEKCFKWDVGNCSFWTEFDGDKSSYKVVFYEGDLSEKCCKPALDRSYCGSARGNLLYLQLVTNEAQRPIILRSGISICSFKWNFQTGT